MLLVILLDDDRGSSRCKQAAWIARLGDSELPFHDRYFYYWWQAIIAVGTGLSMMYGGAVVVVVIAIYS